MGPLASQRNVINLLILLSEKSPVVKTSPIEVIPFLDNYPLSVLFKL